MGILQDFANAQAVNEALKKGVAAHEATETLETDILKVKEEAVMLSDIFEPKGWIEQNITQKWNMMGGSATANGTIVSISDTQNTYNSYWCIVDKETQIYCGTSTGYYALCVGVGATGEWKEDSGYTYMNAESSVRYRKSESNLPTLENPMTVAAGTLLVITIPKTDSSVQFYEFDTPYSNTLSPELVLNAKQVKQVTDTIDIQENYLIYSDGNLCIYMPSGNGFVRYLFEHSISESMHVDVWRIDKASGCDSEFNVTKDLTVTGEWECAISLYGRPTAGEHFGSGFIGGKQHGNEMLTAVTFFVDGVPVDITTYTTMTKFTTLNIIQSTNMFDSSDDTTVCALRGVNHTFAQNGVTIKQSLEWKLETQLRTSYMAMFPVSKSVTSKLITDSSWVVKEADGIKITEPKATYAMLYDETQNFMSEFFVTKYPQNLDSYGDYFMCTDNTTDQSGLYNKCYYVLCGNGGTASVSVGDLWQSETHYKLENVGAW